MESFLQSSHEHLEFPEAVQKRLVSQKGNVLHIVVGLVDCAALVHFLGVLGLLRVYSFENTEPSICMKYKWEKG